MSRKRYTPEQIIGLLREAEVLLSQGMKTPEVCRRLGVSEQSYYRWRHEYGGLKLDQAKRSVAGLEDLAVQRQAQLAAFADRLTQLEARARLAETRELMGAGADG